MVPAGISYCPPNSAVRTEHVFDVWGCGISLVFICALIRPWISFGADVGAQIGNFPPFPKVRDPHGSGTSMNDMENRRKYGYQSSSLLALVVMIVAR